MFTINPSWPLFSAYWRNANNRRLSIHLRTRRLFLSYSSKTVKRKKGACKLTCPSKSWSTNCDTGRPHWKDSLHDNWLNRFRRSTLQGLRLSSSKVFSGCLCRPLLLCFVGSGYASSCGWALLPRLGDLPTGGNTCSTGGNTCSSSSLLTSRQHVSDCINSFTFFAFSSSHIWSKVAVSSTDSGSGSTGPSQGDVFSSSHVWSKVSQSGTDSACGSTGLSQGDVFSSSHVWSKVSQSGTDSGSTGLSQGGLNNCFNRSGLTSMMPFTRPLGTLDGHSIGSLCHRSVPPLPTYVGIGKKPEPKGFQWTSR